MKRLAFAIGFALIATTAQAADVQLPLNDGAQQTVSQLPGAMDQCIASLTLRNDASVCKNVSGVLVALANEVKGAQARAADAAKLEAEKLKTRGK